MLTESHGWEPRSTNAITTKTTYWKLRPRLGTRPHHKGTKFYLHYKRTIGQQLRVPQLANHSLQKWYKMEELTERSPTLPQTYQTMAGNDGKSLEKLTVNSTRVRRTEVDNRENISLNVASKRCVPTYVNDVAQTQQLVANPSSGFLSANQKRRRTTYVIQTLALAQNNQMQATLGLTIVDICSQLDHQTTHMRTNLL
ncbi:hypothetical protein F511_40212 [Dorcoceras hygrometricum]|uniref:Uncharacterized protein n=1 Tax=Dorcoceras hygrometricum TaxID=472368 RepID=A0A2Z7AYI9_9LAMI|nr:hypothetical protein F511_40212 [Dorcoceras hygrometricum]